MNKSRKPKKWFGNVVLHYKTEDGIPTIKIVGAHNSTARELKEWFVPHVPVRFITIKKFKKSY